MSSVRHSGARGHGYHGKQVGIWGQNRIAVSERSGLRLIQETNAMGITINSPVDAPLGLQCAPEFLAKEEQAVLISRLENLDWDSVGLFKRRGKIVKRREIDFIHDYGRHSRTLSEGPPLPQFLQPLRAQCAAALDLEPDDFQQVICSLYRPGAGIDWHIDSLKAFGDTICGISLGSECVMRFRRRRDDKPWRLTLSRGSLLVLRGPARYEFQHQIPAVKETRYSITLRTLTTRRSLSRLL